MRLFIAVPLPQPLADSALALQARLKRRFSSGVKWTSPAQFHLTLHFLGEVEEGRLDALKELLRRTAGRPCFEIALQGAGAFPSLQRPQVLWAGVADAGSGLSALHELLKPELQAQGFAVENRPFKSHLTLGRVKNAPPPGLAEALKKEASDAVSPAAPVQSVELLESRLSPSGPEYAIVSNVRLGEKI
ncbi:MAG TPA: RNA 2',3'-cyclic phosphodiesterase [Elusimicrobiales bacterium]|nr:RNA 2',3'-cyclic phosphodiesterase [Elusimicrobiales bacterium]